ncbi:transglycosylase family protein [Streptomyces sp. NPDC088729]|uniref:transglycosylase family protein n=1 Tax=Streptomyces sp. NPDC088729 TaxID=3365876 RepID=UPI00381E5BCA
MGSANGRHRRPRQAPAIVVAAGVTGSAIAIPLLGAGGAHAAEAGTWDRVAECESGGMWSADLGNGQFGGLQFSQKTWSAYGGKAFAPRADLASRSQQIAVAEKVLADQGPQAWASCAAISGLALGGGLPGVDPGAGPAEGAAEDPEPAPTGKADGAGGADGTDRTGGAGKTGGAAGSAGSDETGQADKSNKGDSGDNDTKGDTSDAGGGGSADGGPGASLDPSPSPSAPPASEGAGPSAGPDAAKGSDRTGGKHRGAPAPEEAGAAGGGDGGRESGRHASRGEGEARDGAADAGGSYTVRPGDSLWAIADAQELPGGWSGLYASNKDVLGSDPDLILPGQSLDLGLEADVPKGS